MIYIYALLFAVILGLALRKIAFKGINKETVDFLNRKDTTLEKELQDFINTQNNNIRVLSAHTQYLFKYKKNEYTCIIAKFKIEGQNDWYTGIISDSGSCTEFKKFSTTKCLQDGYILLKKIYKKPKREINEESFIYLPKLNNIYNFIIAEDEKIIFNSIIKIFKTDSNKSIGLNAKLSMTNKKIYIHNGVGLWKIDLYNDISDYKKDNLCIEIALSEICIFGQPGIEDICTGFKLYFNNEDLNKFENLLNNIIK